MRDLSFKNINIVKSPIKRAGVRNAGPMLGQLSDFQLSAK
jgi:hypothetical protein